MNGREKCKILREIRQKIALDNNISLVTNECKHKGECKGTCPKCESEVIYLENELRRKRSMGQYITIAGLALSSTVGLSACFETEGDVAEEPSYYSDDVSSRENARRGAIYRNLIDYIKSHPVSISDTTNLKEIYSCINFIVSPEGKMTEIKNFYGDDQVLTIFENYLKEIPQEILSGLSTECIYRLDLYIEGNEIIVRDSYPNL